MLPFLQVIVLHLSGAPTEPEALEVYWTPNLKLFDSGGFAGFDTHFCDSRRWRSRRDTWTGGRRECGTKRRLEAVVPLILEWTSSRSAASGDHGEPLEVGHRWVIGVSERSFGVLVGVHTSKTLNPTSQVDLPLMAVPNP